MAQRAKKVSEIEEVKAAIKSSEARHRYFNELGATKLAVLWVIENVEVDTSSGTRRKKKK